MSDPIISTPASVAPGQIEFYDRIAPPLSAASYTLAVRQDILELKQGPVDPYQMTQQFVVSAPRFRIDPATIHMVFPPANQLGSFYDVLPNIVFKDFALPWLRNINPVGGEDPNGPPWMGLLTLYEAEMPPAPGQPAPTGNTPLLSFPATIPAGQVVKPDDPSILPPVLPDVDPASTEAVLVTDVDLAFFQGIAPTLAELGYLAHARVVNTDGKVMLGMNDDGCFSVVVGNRVPLKASSNTVLLVSFEGHQEHLPGQGAIDSRYKKIRLVVLGSWSFQAADMPGSFLALMSQLQEPGRGGVELLKMPAPAGPALEPMVQEALAIGYVALQSDLRDGESTTSFYRGPLVAAPTVQDFSYGPYYFSDHAVLYDPTYGIFNQGYACAWQIGRLLALADASFVQGLVAWRRNYAAARAEWANQQRVVHKVGSALNGRDAPPLSAGLSVQLRHFFAHRVAAHAPHLPTVVPRTENPRLLTLPGAAQPSERLTSETHEADFEPLLLLRARLTGAKTP